MPKPKKRTRKPASARTLIRSLGLAPHPEGGYYREIHRSGETVQSPKGARSALTTIYFLLLRGQTSAFHRVFSDEIWHHYAGAPLRLWRVTGNFRKREAILLGPTVGKTPKARGAVQVAVIPGGDWQAAETLGAYTLVGCSVGPGFDFADFKLMRDEARAARRMRKSHGDLAGLI